VNERAKLQADLNARRPMVHSLARGSNAHDALVFSILPEGPPGTLATPDNLKLFAGRMGSWKVIRDPQRKIDALYNLDDDLAELNDVSAAHPEKKAAGQLRSRGTTSSRFSSRLVATDKTAAWQAPLLGADPGNYTALPKTSKNLCG
jgi:hypothetical protein